MLLAIEDLHWADRSTRAFLAFLARSLRRERVLVVATYRPDELHRRHPLRPLLAELEREPRARRIDLAPLTRAELAEQLDDILGAAARRRTSSTRLFARTEGNPLFAEELLAAGLDGRGALPPTLRDALMIRIEAPRRERPGGLRVIAAGRSLDHALLAEATGLEPRRAARGAARGRGQPHPRGRRRGRLRFRHALLREVVDDDLLPGERAELHLRWPARSRPRAERGGLARLAAAIAHHYPPPATSRRR